MRRVFWQEKGTIEQILTILGSYGVVAGTSDTIVGLFACASKSGVQALDEIKGRSNKPYIILIENISKTLLFADSQAVDKVEKLALHCWPGPVSLILPARKDLDPALHAHTGAVALRVPNDKYLHELLGHVDGLLSTSANKAGEPVATCVDDIDPTIMKQVSLVVEAKNSSGCGSVIPSTILDCTKNHVHVVRQGSFSIKDLRCFCGKLLAMCQGVD